MQRGFTLIELLATMGIIVVLAVLIIAAVAGVGESYEKLETQYLVKSLSQSLDLYAVNENVYPAPDGSNFLEVDWTIDEDDVAQLKDFQTWPVLNKLGFKLQFTFNHDLLRAADADRKRLQDFYQQDLRYTLGEQDDNGHTVVGLFDDWNWNSDLAKAVDTPYPYVYSYGLDNADGSNTSVWIYNSKSGN